MAITLGAGSAQAATFTVVAGTDALNENGQCQLSEAIQNINDQAQTNADCVAGDGSNDTIQLPNGTITLSADLPVITTSIRVTGQSTATSVITGVGQYSIFQQLTTGSAEYTNFTLRAHKGIGVFILDANTIIASNLELDGTGSIAGPINVDPNTVLAGGLAGGSFTAQTSVSVDVQNVYVHDYEIDDAMIVAGVGFQAPLTNMAASLDNVTVKNISNAGVDFSDQAIGVYLSSGNGTPGGTMTAAASNITIDGVEALGAGPASGLAVIGVSSGGAGNMTANIHNATIRGVRSLANQLDVSGGLAVIGGAETGSSSTIALTTHNVTLADNLYDNQPRNCRYQNLNPGLGENGTVSTSFTSVGGNVSDDASCSADFFDQASDRNSQTTLKNFLGTLGDNGGSVPTIPLLPGAVAIDGGVCDNAPSEDARGITRPQGRTCDSGAFELEQDTIASTAGIATATGAAKAYIETAPGVAVTESSPVAVTVADGSNSYPLGLVSFTLAVPTASTQTINVDFETTLALDSITARKFKSATQAYADIPGVTLTEGTRNNKRVVRATYQITDGGALDADGQANGVIVDPVGLALKPTIPRVGGILLGIGGPLMLTMVALASYIIFDWRRHLKPLIAEDPTVRYTLWHHLRVVSIPLFQYRFSVVVSQRDT
jgi:hypothetical protein